mmetsp:Transcript_7799/g.18850  ORF Transcript_7799/g.18850 Transcript_7799/m.18850 type:complete len:107 (+) Transcript_7799:1618-1938(+)
MAKEKRPNKKGNRSGEVEGVNSIMEEYAGLEAETLLKMEPISTSSEMLTFAGEIEISSATKRKPIQFLYTSTAFTIRGFATTARKRKNKAIAADEKAALKYMIETH